MLIITPKIDLNGERWFSPVDGLRLLVTSSENPQYRSRNALVRRHIDKLDARSVPLILILKKWVTLIPLMTY